MKAGEGDLDVGLGLRGVGAEDDVVYDVLDDVSVGRGEGPLGRRGVGAGGVGGPGRVPSGAPT